MEGYRKKKEMKLSIHTASCTKGWPLKFHSGRPSYLWLMKCTRANVARGRLIAAKMTLKALAPMSSSPEHQILSYEMRHPSHLHPAASGSRGSRTGQECSSLHSKEHDRREWWATKQGHRSAAHHKVSGRPGHYVLEQRLQRWLA